MKQINLDLFKPLSLQAKQPVHGIHRTFSHSSEGGVNPRPYLNVTASPWVSHRALSALGVQKESSRFTLYATSSSDPLSVHLLEPETCETSLLPPTLSNPRAKLTKPWGLHMHNTFQFHLSSPLCLVTYLSHHISHLKLPLCFSPLSQQLPE